jgi:glycosyltransferase involved in cell wall biosynthesis
MYYLAAPLPGINNAGIYSLPAKNTVITNLRIAILGTRGIPNQYGGFEQAAAYISTGLAEKGHEVTVYSPHSHPYRDNSWNGVNIVHCYAPEFIGSAGQFIYDLGCMLNARKKHFDVWLILGYTSSSVWGWLYPKKTVLISNMDGLEWKRSKYSNIVKRFLLAAEKLAVRYSHFLIADSPAIQSYLLEKYRIASEYIAYGADIPVDKDEQALSALAIERYGYYLVIARMEPENNIEMIVNGFCRTDTDKIMLIVGNIDTAFGKYLTGKFKNNLNVVFAGPVYDSKKLSALKSYCRLYFHGHSCGGTNPSLLEAMASGALICAHDNPFNKAVLGEDAFYFKSEDDIRILLEGIADRTTEGTMTTNNLAKIKAYYNWPRIVSEYERFIIDCHNDFTK